MSTYLQAFVERLYPGATVTRDPLFDRWVVRFTVAHEDLISGTERALRDVVERMRPKFPTRRRKLYWGRRAG
jgi:hypothetical protein